MRNFLFALPVAVAVFTTPVDAQYPSRYPVRTWPGYTVPRYVPTPAYRTAPSYVFPVQPGYGISGEADFIRSLYLQYLQREPDPQGLQTWLTRFAVLGGDVQRLTLEFSQAAFIEQNSNNPAYRLRLYP